MKRILKADRMAFNKAVREILAPYPFAHESTPDRPRHLVMTAYGPLDITPDPLEHGDRIPTVFMRFRFTDTFTSEHGSKHPLGGINGKWNIHEWATADALQTLSDRLRMIDARPPTPDEQAAIVTAYEAEQAYWSRMRDEWEQEKATAATP